jgi:hypothetical protein
MTSSVDIIQQQLEKERKLYRDFEQNMRTNPLQSTFEKTADFMPTWNRAEDKQNPGSSSPVKQQDSDTAFAKKIALASKRASADSWQRILDQEQKTALKVGSLILSKGLA